MDQIIPKLINKKKSEYSLQRLCILITYPEK